MKQENENVTIMGFGGKRMNHEDCDNPFIIVNSITLRRFCTNCGLELYSRRAEERRQRLEALK